MGITEAKKYIQKLHKKQNNPYLWPDFLTGLPDKAAIIKKLETVFPQLGKYSIAYVRISNIHPYLIKYGPDRHAEIIQWAAAILSTTSSRCVNSFVGTLSTHDFIVMCNAKNVPKLLKEASKAFSKKIEDYYSKEDRKSRTTLSFKRNGEEVKVGLMKFIAVIADKKIQIRRSHLIQDMGRVCESLEGTDSDMILMTDDMVCRDE